MIALPPRNSNKLAAIQLVTPEAVKKFIIAAVCRAPPESSWVLDRTGPRLDCRRYAVRAFVTTLFVGGSNSGEPGETFWLRHYPKANGRSPLLLPPHCAS